MKRILIIEDDHHLSESISSFLIKDNYLLDPAFDGQAALKLFTKEHYDLVIMDLNLPRISGVDLCKAIRKVNPQVPIVIITAFGDIDSKMEAFDLGADDYIVKPFHLKELSAKVKVFLKRAESTTQTSVSYEHMGLILDGNKKEVTREGKRISLTPKEYSLLEYLLKNKNRIVSKDELSRNVWDENYGISSNTIEVYINFLRNKIDKDFATKLVLTKPGFGYYLASSHEL